MALKRAKAVLIGLAIGAIPLITTGACDPRTGVLDFYRDDDNDGFLDVIYDSYYYYDPYYYDPYYDDGYYYEDCWLCF